MSNIQTGPIKFHKNHVVKCQSCKEPVLAYGKTVINATDGEEVQYYRCSSCGSQFRCCPDPLKGLLTPMSDKVRCLNKRISEYKAKIKQLQRQVDRFYL